MARWEYMRERDPTPAEMAAFGRDGWELVAIDSVSMFHFKRPLVRVPGPEMA